jgi:hypothetical protein
MSFISDVTYCPQLYLDYLAGKSSGQSVIENREEELAIKIKLDSIFNSFLANAIVGVIDATFLTASALAVYTLHGSVFNTVLGTKEQIISQCRDNIFWVYSDAEKIARFMSSSYQPLSCAVLNLSLACYETVLAHPYIILAGFVTTAALCTIHISETHKDQDKKLPDELFKRLQDKFDKVSKRLENKFKNAKGESIQKIKNSAQNILKSKEKIIGEIETLDIFSRKQIKMIIAPLIEQAQSIVSE